MKLEWDKHKDGKWVDYRSTDGKWWIAEGYDEAARKDDGKPYSLFFLIQAKPEKWNKVDVFKTVAEAKACAKELKDDC